MISNWLQAALPSLGHNLFEQHTHSKSFPSPARSLAEAYSGRHTSCARCSLLAHHGLALSLNYLAGSPLNLPISWPSEPRKKSTHRNHPKSPITVEITALSNSMVYDIRSTKDQKYFQPCKLSCKRPAVLTSSLINAAYIWATTTKSHVFGKGARTAISTDEEID